MSTTADRRCARSPAARNPGAPHDALCLVGIDERVVEQPEAALVAQQPTRRLVDPLLGDPSGTHELDEHLGQLLAAELVATGLDDLDQPVLDAQLLDAPALRREDRAVRQRRVGHQPPVGADDAVEAVVPAQQPGDDVAVVAEADLLELGADRPAVVRHDLRGPGRERGLEHPQVVVEHAAGIHLILAVGKCGSSPSRCGPPPGKCLVMHATLSARARRPGSRVCTPRPAATARSASSPNVCMIRAQRGSVARSAIGCSATWIPTARYSRRAMSPNSRTACSSRSAPNPIGSGHCENPLAAHAAARFSVKLCRGSEEIVTGMPSRVARASVLQPVVPLRLLPRRGREVDVEVVEMPLGDALLGAVEQRAVLVHEDRRVEHQPGLLLERHLREQVLDPALDRARRHAADALTSCGRGSARRAAARPAASGRRAARRVHQPGGAVALVQLEQRLERLRLATISSHGSPRSATRAGHGRDRQVVGVDRVELVPAERRRHLRAGPGTHRPRAEDRLVGRVLVVVEEDAAAALLLPPGRGDQVGPAPFELRAAATAADRTW